MNKATLLTALKNLGWLVLVALPVFFLLVWLQALVGRAEGSRDLGYALETGGFYYLASVLYVLLGGLVHQVLVFLLPASSSPPRRRVIALLLTPVVPLALVPGGGLGTLLEFLIPTVLALATYGVLMRIPGVPARESA